MSVTRSVPMSKTWKMNDCLSVSVKRRKDGNGAAGPYSVLVLKNRSVFRLQYALREAGGAPLALEDEEQGYGVAGGIIKPGGEQRFLLPSDIHDVFITDGAALTLGHVLFRDKMCVAEKGASVLRGTQCLPRSWVPGKLDSVPAPRTPVPPAPRIPKLYGGTERIPVS